MLSMRLHSQWMQVAPEKILVTGGAANDRALLQVLADVMNCRVQRIEVSKGAALGAAFGSGGILIQTFNPLMLTISPLGPWFTEEEST